MTGTWLVWQSNPHSNTYLICGWVPWKSVAVEQNAITLERKRRWQKYLKYMQCISALHWASQRTHTYFESTTNSWHNVELQQIPTHLAFSETVLAEGHLRLSCNLLPIELRPRVIACSSVETTADANHPWAMCRYFTVVGTQWWIPKQASAKPYPVENVPDFGVEVSGYSVQRSVKLAPPQPLAVTWLVCFAQLTLQQFLTLITWHTSQSLKDKNTYTNTKHKINALLLEQFWWHFPHNLIVPDRSCSQKHTVVWMTSSESSCFLILYWAPLKKNIIHRKVSCLNVCNSFYPLEQRFLHSRPDKVWKVRCAHCSHKQSTHLDIVTQLQYRGRLGFVTGGYNGYACSICEGSVVAIETGMTNCTG